MAANGTDMRRFAWAFWAAFTVLLAAPVILGYVLPPGLLMRMAGLLSVPHEHCVLCGMTRAYCCLVHNQVRDAYTLNPLAPFMFYLSWLNMAMFAGFVLWRVRRSKTRR